MTPSISVYHICACHPDISMFRVGKVGGQPDKLEGSTDGLYMKIYKDSPPHTQWQQCMCDKLERTEVPYGI